MIAALFALAPAAQGDLRSSARDQYWSQDSPGMTGSAAPDENFGRSVAVGDFNDDGAEDMAVGVPGQTIGASANAGGVHVIYGSDTGLVSTVSAVENDKLFHQGTPGVGGAVEVGDRFGYTVTVGNFNGDDYADLAVGAPFENVGATSNVGGVHVLYGGPNGLTGSGSDFFYPGDNAENTPATPNAPEANDRFGTVLSAGDYDNDGRDDLAIGIPLEDVGAVSNAGAVLILRGGAGGVTTSNPLQIQDDGFGGVEAAEQFGSNLESGDFNGDGVDDLAVQARYESVGGFTPGAVTIWHGRNSVGPNVNASSASFSLSSFGAPAANNDRFGDGLGANDYNGDGVHDLAIGSPFADTPTAVNGGFVHVLYGTAGSPLSATRADELTFASPGMATIATGSTELGELMAEGEFDGDDYGDLAIGYSPNRLLVLHGTSTGLGTARSHVIDKAGTAASMATGDMDDNGVDDLAVGNPNARVTGDNNAGQVFVRYGRVTPMCNNQFATVDIGLGQEPTDGDDIIVGTSGDDNILAGRGDDIVCAGDGDDRVRGQGGDDVLFGGKGADNMKGGAGEDRVLGESGADRLWGNSKADVIRGGTGPDLISGGKSNDFIKGGGGNDEIRGNAGDDRIWGNSGADELFGGKKNDRIRGGKGPDDINGGPGTDDCRGGGGSNSITNCEP